MLDIFLDTETTGLNEYNNGVWQLAAIAIRDGQTLDKFEEKMRVIDGDAISAKALEIGGVTKEDVTVNFQEARRVKLAFEQWMKQWINPFDRSQKAFMYAYNAQFDYKFLRAWYEKQGDRFFGSYFWNPAIDVMSMAMQFLKEERSSMKNFQQGTVAEKLGIEMDESKLHDALYDVELTIQIYNHIVNHKQ